MLSAHLEQLYTALASIPTGQVITYGDLAKMIGMPNQARWVGRQLSRLPEGSRLPWHRVINSQGRSSFPKGSAAYERQLALLEEEGVQLNTSGSIPRRYRYVIVGHNTQ